MKFALYFLGAEDLSYMLKFAFTFLFAEWLEDQPKESKRQTEVSEGLSERSVSQNMGSKG